DIGVYLKGEIKQLAKEAYELFKKELELLNMTSWYAKQSLTDLKWGFLYPSLKEALNGLRLIEEAETTYNKLLTALAKLPIPIPKGIIKKLNHTINDYNSLFLETIKRIKEQSKNISLTTLSINVSSREVWINSTVEVTGYLTLVNGKPLGFRGIKVFLGNKSIDTLTDTRGFFYVRSHIPFYSPNLTIYAVYTPKNIDKDRLAATRSEVINLRVLYITPTLRVHLDKPKVMPLERVNIYGKVKPAKLKIWVKGFNSLYNLTPNPDGEFNLSIIVPPSVLEKRYHITVGTYPRGIIAPSSIRLILKVYKSPLYVTVSSPLWTLSGLTWNLEGKVKSKDEILKNTKVIIKVLNKTIILKTDEKGAFTFNLRFPFTLLTSSYKLRITVIPDVPWLREDEIELEVMTISPLTVATPLAISLTLTRRALLKRKKILPRDARPRISRERSIAIKKRELSGIPAIYNEALKLVERYTGIKALPSYTVREYLSRVKPKIGEAFPYFEELSLILEKVVYGNIKVDLKNSEALLSKLKSALRVSKHEESN
ncbi:MAG: hypothetical protein DRJ41_01530, partial [Thermoprotei archaeon]